MIEVLPPFEYFKNQKPFSFLNDDELAEIIRGLESEIFRKGATIFRRGGKPLKYVYIVKCGRVELRDGTNEVLTEGDLFGVASALSGNPPRFTAVALEDSVCYLIRRNSFLKIFNSNQKFADFFTSLLSRRLSSLLKLSKKAGHGLDRLYSVRVADVVSRDAVTCTPETSVLEAAQIMDRNKVGSVVVVNGKKPVGIFTQRDLMKLVARGVNLEESVGSYMTSPIISVSESDSLIDAYLAIVTNAINHIVVMSNGDVKGVVSTKDILLRLSSASSLLSISRKIVRAGIDELEDVMDEARTSIEDMISSGADFEEMSKIACGLYELIVKRCAKLTLDGCVFLAGDFGRGEAVLPPVHMGVIADDWQKFVNAARRIGLQPIDVSNSMDGWFETINEWFSHPDEFAWEILRFMDTRHIFGPKDAYATWKKKFEEELERRAEDVARVFAAESRKEGDMAKALLYAIKAAELRGIRDEEAIEAYRVVRDVTTRRTLGCPLSKIDELLLKEAGKILARLQESL
ncbi:CBS domain-containing protein [Archaeoglobus veneficus]|uniref:Putative CBS domain and cyclic nucleotide-regulated nucleotidyltransferase n=1 Tax=Archaeoglobus veneficus (strain DSM 11195 / SNP6) TaxID=693661 RepID=F2KPD6_ARCVS|nr:CBS domain-containing protein [Archaeoglobus veneficus]AEA46367.1 putative CBS domain and cyclic nucleotide-regulated nucleotidyltransferase [Archaeoglobus veneficus SNP6]